MNIINKAIAICPGEKQVGIETSYIEISGLHYDLDAVAANEYERQEELAELRAKLTRCFVSIYDNPRIHIVFPEVENIY